MIVLHAGIVEGGFFLWGEKPPEDGALQKPVRRGRSKTRMGAAPLPFPHDAGIQEITAGLKEAGLRFALQKKHVESLWGWFPTAGGQAVPSTPLIAASPEPTAEVPLRRWTLTAVSLNTAQAVDLLCACTGKLTLAHGVIIGKDLGFWVHALRFGGSLVARQRFLPDVAQENGTYWARWNPVINGPDAERLRDLARAMPAVSRALVQGSRPKPYDVTIRIKVLPTASWKKLAATLSRQALFLAKLLSGEMPEDIEKAFAKEKMSLFPKRRKDLETDCSCPDWSNPCKHIAAVYYLLGEEFDRDPFLIFKLRGMSREELLDLLGGAGKKDRRKKGKGELAGPGEAVQQKKDGLTSSEPLPSKIPPFWEGGRLPEDFFGEVQIPTLPGALLKSLGHFPFWRGQEHFMDALEPVYIQASTIGMDVFLGEKDPSKVIERS